MRGREEGENDVDIEIRGVLGFFDVVFIVVVFVFGFYDVFVLNFLFWLKLVWVVFCFLLIYEFGLSYKILGVYIFFF